MQDNRKDETPPEPDSRRVRIDLEYLGGRYAGWQWQDNALSIQQVVEEALAAMVRHPVRVTASGRTDAGVHALLQPTHVDLATNMEDVHILRGLNSLLPEDIAVRAVATVDGRWNARKSAVRKTYRYMIHNSRIPSVFLHGRVWRIPHPLDIPAMQTAAAMLVGERDFASFRASGCSSKSPVRNLMALDVATGSIEEFVPGFSSTGEGEEELVIMTFTGSGFLKQMVRNMVGTLVEVGRGKMAPEQVGAILEAKDRRAAGPCAPPQGLCLIDVIYD